jgi:hypothetical protein
VTRFVKVEQRPKRSERLASAGRPRRMRRARKTARKMRTSMGRFAASGWGIPPLGGHLRASESRPWEIFKIGALREEHFEPTRSDIPGVAARVGSEDNCGGVFRQTGHNCGQQKVLQIRHPEGLKRRTAWFQPSGDVAVVVAGLRRRYSCFGPSGIVAPIRWLTPHYIS